jgi:hypothetical protein
MTRKNIIVALVAFIFGQLFAASQFPAYTLNPETGWYTRPWLNTVFQLALWNVGLIIIFFGFVVLVWERVHGH